MKRGIAIEFSLTHTPTLPVAMHPFSSTCVIAAVLIKFFPICITFRKSKKYKN